jgi:hypothetical protein
VIQFELLKGLKKVKKKDILKQKNLKLIAPKEYRPNEVW